MISYDDDMMRYNLDIEIGLTLETTWLISTTDRHDPNARTHAAQQEHALHSTHIALIHRKDNIIKER